MAITTKPPASAGNPIAKTTIAEDTAGNPVSKTTISEASAGNATSKTTISEASAGNPVSKTTIAENDAGNPVSKTTIAENTAVNAVVKTTVPAAAFPRTLIPLVDMHFDTNSYSQNGDPVLFDDLFTYSRNSSATFINRRIVNNRPEFFLDTDFVGNVTNLALFSKQFDNAAWVKANSTILANNDFNIDGLKIADRLHPATTGTLRGISQAITATTAEHNVSFRVKAAGFSWIKIFDAANTNGAWFNVSAGVVGTITGSCEPSIIPSGDDWYRCSIGDAGAVSGFANIILADADNSTTATLNGIDGVLLDAAQLTLGVKPLPYVKTISSTVLQAFTETLRVEYDPVTGKNLGALIEGASTNLALRSEEFDNATWTKTRSSITANLTKAPDDTFSADKLIEDATASATHLILQDVNVTSGNDYTISIFARAAENNLMQLTFGSVGFSGSQRANFNLLTGQVETVSGGSAAITKLFDGWFRCSFTATASSTGVGGMLVSFIENGSDARTPSFTGDGISGFYIWGAQHEQQSLVTSYIRTEGSTVSRVADALNISNAGNYPNSGDFTLFAKVNINDLPLGGSGATRFVSTSAPVSQTSRVRVSSSGLLQVSHGSGTSTIASDGAFSGSFDVAMVFDSSTNLLKSYLNGVEMTSADTGSMFQSDLSGTLDIGTNLFGHIKSMPIYDVSLTAQEVALL